MNAPFANLRASHRHGFTLVEVLASVTIIGILIFLAIPSIISVRRDAEENVAIARAEALNIAISSYIDAYGLQKANTSWTSATGTGATAKDNYRYVNFLAPYISYAPTSLGSFIPAGYSITLPTNLANLDKVTLRKPLKGSQTVGDQLSY